jgi:hypothetical protein
MIFNIEKCCPEIPHAHTMPCEPKKQILWYIIFQYIFLHVSNTNLWYTISPQNFTKIVRIIYHDDSCKHIINRYTLFHKPPPLSFPNLIVLHQNFCIFLLNTKFLFIDRLFIIHLQSTETWSKQEIKFFFFLLRISCLSSRCR